MEANKNFDKWLILGRRISGTFRYTYFFNRVNQEMTA
jgi:hypothetical protein